MSSSFLLAGPIVAQTLIENPARPAASGADRIVDLKEVLRITDEGAGFFLKYPFRLQVGADGAMFVQEQEQLLKFDRDGKYLRNFFRKGQGPGEILYISGFLPLERGVLVQSSYPGKMIWYGEDGALIKETALRCPFRGFELFGKDAGTFLFLARGNPFEAFTGASPAVVDVKHHILVWKEGESDLKESVSFPVGTYVIKSVGGGGGMIPIDPMAAVPAGDGRLVLANTQEYLVKVFDFAAGTIVRSFRRVYDRVKFEPPQHGGLTVDGKTYTHAPRKYASDIVSLFVVGDRLWVMTSTRDKEGNPLIDVFDFEGRYLDRFTLRRPTKAGSFFLDMNGCVIRGGFLYQLERDADETPSVAKYEIKDPRSSRNP